MPVSAPRPAAALALALVIAVVTAISGCGKSSANQTGNMHPTPGGADASPADATNNGDAPAGLDATDARPATGADAPAADGSTTVVDAGAGIDIGASDLPVATGTTACVSSTTPPIQAPPDTATPPAPTGPYSWRNVAVVAGGFVTGVVFSPAQRDLAYARTDIGGAYRWNPVARRWMPLTDWIARGNSSWAGIESIAADPRDANKVYLAAGISVSSGSGVILRSSDQGRTFDVATTSIPMGGNNDGRSVGERLAVDPNRPDTLLFGSRTMGLWKSTDGAATWARVTAFPGPATTPNGVGIAFVLFDPASCGSGGQTTAYVAVAVAGTSLFKTNDGGDTWLAVPAQPTGLLPSHGAISSTGKLYVTSGGGVGTAGSGPNLVTTGGVQRLDVASGVWADVTPRVPAGADTFGYAGVSIDAAHPDTVVVSTLDRWAAGDDIFRSTDAGATWKPVGVPGAPHDISAAPWVTFHQAQPNYTGWMSDVKIDPFDSTHVLHVTGQGLWAADDLTAVDANQATHWDFRSVGIEETAVLDLASPPAGASLLSAVGDIGGFRHDDLTVSPAAGMSTNPVLTNTDSIDFAEGNPAIVARVGRIRGADGITLTPSGALSTDGGTTWHPFPTILGAPTNSAGSIAVSADGATLVWDTPANPRGTPATAGGPQVSTDGGQTWTASAGIGAIRPVVADRVNPTKFYAFDAAGNFSVSTDGAATFAVRAQGLPAVAGGRPRATPGIEGDVWLVTRNALLHSTDSGVSFTSLANVTAPVALGFGLAAPGSTTPALYIIGTVASTPGIYRSTDTGTSWTRIDDDQHRFATANLVIGDPRVFGRVYLGTNGRGILAGDPVGGATASP